MTALRTPQGAETAPGAVSSVIRPCSPRTLLRLSSDARGFRIHQFFLGWRRNPLCIERFSTLVVGRKIPNCTFYLL